MAHDSNENEWTEKNWQSLMYAIKAGKCTPFLGAGVNGGVLPLGSQIAKEWAGKYDYPFEDAYDLMRVAEFVSIVRAKITPTEEIKRVFDEAKDPDLDNEDSSLVILADLPLPVYLTTNYDDFMYRALKRRHRNPQKDFSRWNKALQDYEVFPQEFDGVTATIENPIVYHLHGVLEPELSIVLTEEHYLDFLASLFQRSFEVPPRIRRSIVDASLLLVGYSLEDWTFRVLFKSLKKLVPGSCGRENVSVQLPPHVPEPMKQVAREYLRAYFDRQDVNICWRDAEDFLRELRDRWKTYSNERTSA